MGEAYFDVYLRSVDLLVLLVLEGDWENFLDDLSIDYAFWLVDLILMVPLLKSAYVYTYLFADSMVETYISPSSPILSSIFIGTVTVHDYSMELSPLKIDDSSFHFYSLTSLKSMLSCS